VIDHPTDPENKTLRHAAIESNEVLNIYRGNVICDAQGNASIQLPDYFESINTAFSYVLTPVGAPAPGLYVSQEIQGNSFSISGAQAGQKISWQVTAQRHDAWMQAHPFKAESQKPARKAGKLLSPQKGGEAKSYFSTPMLNRIQKMKAAANKPSLLNVR
jgi:hypothetical protein